MDDANRQPAGPACLEMIEFAPDEIVQAGLDAVDARRRQLEQRPPALTDSGFFRNSGKSWPARCMLASARPTPAQCAAFGRRGHTPSRKLMIAAGRPASAL